MTVRDLGKIGRIGNQLFLYAFAKGYAAAHHCELQVGPWFGQEVFVNATESAPVKQFQQTPLDSHTRKPFDFLGKTNIDLFVYGQHQRFIDYYTRAQVREWLKLKPEWEVFGPDSHVPCVAHIRRGDYVSKYSNCYCLIPESSYERAVEKFKLPKPTYVSDEAYPPKHWLSDFLLMRDADHLIRANSSFSWWAATLGHGRVFAPIVGDKVGWNDVEFVESNHPSTAGKFGNQSDLWLRES